VIVRREHFIKMNGFSNEFWGWGGEDEDACQRAENVWLQPVQAPADTARLVNACILMFLAALDVFASKRVLK